MSQLTASLPGKAGKARKKRGFTLVEVIVVLGIIIGLSTVVYGYVQSAQTSSQLAGLYQDIDFLRSAALNYGQTRSGDYSTISVATMVTSGLLPGRFACDPSATDAETLSTDNCGANPFNTAWFVGDVEDKASQYTVGLKIESTRGGAEFYETLASRYATTTTTEAVTQGGVVVTEASSSSISKTPDVVSATPSADGLVFIFQP